MKLRLLIMVFGCFFISSNLSAAKRTGPNGLMSRVLIPCPSIIRTPSTSFHPAFQSSKFAPVSPIRIVIPPLIYRFARNAALRTLHSLSAYEDPVAALSAQARVSYTVAINNYSDNFRNPDVKDDNADDQANNVAHFALFLGYADVAKDLKQKQKQNFELTKLVTIDSEHAIDPEHAI